MILKQKCFYYFICRRYCSHTIYYAPDAVAFSPSPFQGLPRLDPFPRPPRLLPQGLPRLDSSPRPPHLQFLIIKSDQKLEVDWE